MQPPITLSSVSLDSAAGLRRESPRPAHLRNAQYAAQYDWDTLFYDCYRAGRHVVLQGPPPFNLLEPVLASLPRKVRKWAWWRNPRAITHAKRGEIWLRCDADWVILDGPVGHHTIAIQPDLAPLFVGRRVLHTLSKDNAPRWIADWIAFYAAEHGADAALVYDNGSSAYDAASLEAELAARFPAMVIRVIGWPFRYGPQGGLAGAVDGVETPWDSDFCQTGSMQHARHRCLRAARSVLNVDIDELVPACAHGSIFAAAEASRHGFVKFAGHWISAATPDPVDPVGFSLGDFVHRDHAETRVCPPKWCAVPSRHDPWKTSWSVHNLFGLGANRRIDPRYIYRHMAAISTSWKEDRRIEAAFDPARCSIDDELAESFAHAGLR